MQSERGARRRRLAGRSMNVVDESDCSRARSSCKHVREVGGVVAARLSHRRPMSDASPEPSSRVGVNRIALPSIRSKTSFGIEARMHKTKPWVTFRVCLQPPTPPRTGTASSSSRSGKRANSPRSRPPRRVTHRSSYSSTSRTAALFARAVACTASFTFRPRSTEDLAAVWL